MGNEEWGMRNGGGGDYILSLLSVFFQLVRFLF